MQIECSNCHREFEQKDMMYYNPGTKAVWVCWECWKQGQSEAASNEIRRKRQRAREANNKK